VEACSAPPPKKKPVRWIGRAAEWCEIRVERKDGREAKKSRGSSEITERKIGRKKWEEN